MKADSKNTTTAEAVAAGIADARAAVLATIDESQVQQKSELCDDPIDRAYAMAWNAVLIGDV